MRDIDALAGAIDNCDARVIEAWSQPDPTLPNYDPDASPARALRALTALLRVTSKTSTDLREGKP